MDVSLKKSWGNFHRNKSVVIDEGRLRLVASAGRQKYQPLLLFFDGGKQISCMVGTNEQQPDDDAWWLLSSGPTMGIVKQRVGTRAGPSCCGLLEEGQ